ncbi:MAG: MucB/RseB C-terminal domain-containing protein [Methylovulum sp.]|nr:MucB/RseB C-terminal domain-containing protein [Methylovulum sp.]
MIAVKWFFLILPVLPTAVAWAETPPLPDSDNRPATLLQDGKYILKSMVNAMQNLNYQGTVAFLRDGKLEPMRYSHAVNKGHEQEHLLSLNSPLREVVRETGKVSCLYTATQKLIVEQRPFERSFLLDMPSDLGQLDAVYDIEVQGEENIAMLPTLIVALTPKDKLRYAHKIWVSRHWFLPLKVVVYDLAGGTLEERVFTELEVKDVLPFIAMKQPSNTSLLPDSPAESSKQAAFALTALPKGFTEVFFSRKPMRDAEQPVDHLLLSDGLASVSVYMEPKNPAQPPINSGVQTIDAINFFSHTQGDYQVTVMGEVPSETIQFIADHVQLRGQ